MRKLAGIVIAGIFFISMMMLFYHLPASHDLSSNEYYYRNPINGSVANESIPEHYIKYTKNETGAVNAVTAIVVEYRGFDTLGEVTVLFTAATGVSFLLSLAVRGRKREEANLILKEGSKLVLPFILLTGAYIFIHGHLTPGGGFPGGSVVASGFLLMMLAYPKFFMKDRISWFESAAGTAFVVIGLLGLVLATSFLQNFIPVGTPGQLVSAGIIPLIYIAIGFKVGSELSAIVNKMKEVQG
ncbi:MAG: Na(+)/H(+) antiporter subunit B [Thermoplasmata archaeon]|nr:Na(+)/H(+) antiporter subunit B [Thermoplasmata archaeon]